MSDFNTYFEVSAQNNGPKLHQKQCQIFEQFLKTTVPSFKKTGNNGTKIAQKFDIVFGVIFGPLFFNTYFE